MAENASAREKSGTAGGASGGGFLRSVVNLLKKQEVGIFVVAVILFFYFWFANGAFASHDNLVTISQTLAPVAIMALGLVMVMILGEIDLSVGSTFGFAPAIMWIAYDDWRLILPLAVVVALVITAAVGLINGAVRVYFGVPSFVVTLGTFFLLAGVNVILLNGFPVSAPSGTTRTVLGNYLYSEIIWAVVILLVMHLLLKNTRWGLHTFATGGNFIGSKESGIKVNRIRIVNFVICAVLAGFAGILEAMRIGSIDPLAGGAQTMFFAIAAAVIGGTPLAGGVGTMIGAFFGAIVYAELKQGFTLLGINANTFNVILGAAIMVLMIFNIYLGTLRRGGGLGWLRRSGKRGAS